MAKVVLPSFSGEEYQSHEMRQLVSALDLRFQSIESASFEIFDTSGVDDGSGYSPIGHTHIEVEITDLGDYLTDLTSESIFSLLDVAGTPIDCQLSVFSSQ